MSDGALVVLGPHDSRIAAHLIARAEAAEMPVTRHEPAADAPGAALSVQVQDAIGSADVVLDATVSGWPDHAGTLAEVERAMRVDGLLIVCAHATSATAAAAAVHHPERVVGFGLLPPCEERETVELARAIQTSDEASARAVAFWGRLGHEAIEVGDGAGLVVARVVSCLANEAAFAAMEGVATPGDIDIAMRLGTGYPRGPLEWCDLVGACDIVAVLDALAAEHGDDRFRAAPRLRRMAAAGALWEVNHGRQ